jgi:hypothetical protein
MIFVLALMRALDGTWRRISPRWGKINGKVHLNRVTLLYLQRLSCENPDHSILKEIKIDAVDFNSLPIHPTHIVISGIRASGGRARAGRHRAIRAIVLIVMFIQLGHENLREEVSLRFA